MRQFREDELVHLIQQAIRVAPRSALNKITHFDAATSLTARLVVARSVAEKMKRLEILCDGSEPFDFKYPDFDAKLIG